MDAVLTADRSAQFNALLHQKYVALEMMGKSNDALDDKAAKILQTSSLIVALVGLLASPELGTAIQHPPLVLVAGILLAFMCMVALCILSVSPSQHFLPGSQDWDQNYECYIEKEPEQAFGQILSDSLKAIESLTTVNTRKAKFVKISAYLLLGQIAALLVFLFVALS